MTAPTPPADDSGPRICDYEGSPYRRVFWEEADRAFEDAAERLAVRALLPHGGGRVLDIGAGFGRLAPEYASYREPFLLDYAPSMLADAHARLGDAATFVCADLYRLPFATGSLDAVIQVRVLHHVENVPAAFAEVARVLRPGGAYILEFANKRHLKALLRFALRRQREDPTRPEPHEFVPLNWNFHPRSIDEALAAASLRVEARRAVSHFRLPILKRMVPADALARADAAIGGRLGALAVAPSQFVRARRGSDGRQADGLWRCPACGAEPLARRDDAVPCPACGRSWPVAGEIYLFRDVAADA